MKKQLFVLIYTLVTLSVSSQNKDFSIDINYPVSLGNHSYKISKYPNSKGIIDINIKCRLNESSSSKIGISYSLNIIKFNSGYSEFDPYNIRKYHHYYSHINLFWEPKIVSSDKTHPFISIGYSRLISLKEKNTFDSIKESNNGMNFKFGIQYDLFRSFYLQSNFQFIRTKFETRWKRNKDNNNLVHIGFGYRF